MVSDLPVYRRSATSVTVWIQKKDDFVSRESGTNKELRNWLMVSNILFHLLQTIWVSFFIAKITNIRSKLNGILAVNAELNLESESGDIVFSQSSTAKPDWDSSSCDYIWKKQILHLHV